MANINLQCLLGIQCNDFVMIAADQSASHSIMVMKDGEFAIFDKHFRLASVLLLILIYDYR